MPIYVSDINPRLTINQLRAIGYTGRTLKEVLKKVKKHYPAARIVK